MKQINISLKRIVQRDQLIDTSMSNTGFRAFRFNSREFFLEASL